MTTTRRTVYAQIANAVLAGLPEPQSQSLSADGTDGPYLFLNFDTHADARLWARWLSPICVDSERWDEHEPTATRAVWYWGERPGDEGGWGWNIVGREPLPDFDSKIWACPEGCGYNIADGPVPDGEDSTDELIRQHMEEHQFAEPTVEQVTIAALAPDSLRVPCGRCGHDEDGHKTEDGARLCLDCKGFCSSVVLVSAREARSS